MAAGFDRQLRDALSRAQSRSRKHNRPCDLDTEFLRTLLEQQNGRCVLSGIEFSDETFSEAYVKRPFAPSIDRIDHSKGYTRDNVRLLCTAVNFARGEWGDDVLREIAHGLVEQERRDYAGWYKDKEADLRVAQHKLQHAGPDEAKRLRSRIAGLKATIRKGPARLRSAARRALGSRSET